MTAATLNTEFASQPQAWRPLLWIVPLTAAWLGLNLVFPGLQASGIPAR